jgi:hypothetical protein
MTISGASPMYANPAWSECSEREGATWARPDVAVAVQVEVGRVGSSVASISQALVLAQRGDKRSKVELLLPILVPGERTMVFVQKKHVATWVRVSLVLSGPLWSSLSSRTLGTREREGGEPTIPRCVRSRTLLLMHVVRCGTGEARAAQGGACGRRHPRRPHAVAA